MTRTADRLPDPYQPEDRLVRHHLAVLQGALHWPAAAAVAQPWVRAVRDHPPPFWAMESLLKEYPISSAEGLALMRLAEALLRVPDAETAIALTADQLGRADFEAGSGAREGDEAEGESRGRRAGSALARLSSTAIAMSRHFLPQAGHQPGLMAKLGARTVVAATLRAVQLLGRQFVLGQTIGEGLKEAAAARRDNSCLRFSFDMLGEGARTEADAQRYLQSYRAAIAAIAARNDPRAAPTRNDGISIKLSALHPRYEDAQHSRVMAELVPRVWGLCEAAAAAGLNLTIDAEEVDRLELSLQVFEALAQRVADHCPGWVGLGLALQAYQTRAVELIRHVAELARRHQIRFMCRLVKGAYWDAEIKRAQEMGLPHYPVYTHKHHTDISYLACARALLDAPDAIFPQFATHNAGTIAAILQMAGPTADGAEPAFEMQRLHGMGEGVYREVLKRPDIRCRIYAPVGAHRDLLAYLVRRLLENGANSSFVHQLADETVGLDELLVSPLRLATAAAMPLPPDLYGPARRNSLGRDLAVLSHREALAEAYAQTVLYPVPEAGPDEVRQAVTRACGAFEAWNLTPVTERAAVLRRAADALEQAQPRFCALLVREARKTWGDTVSEVREAVDFLRYYAQQAERLQHPQILPGPTGESNTLRLAGRGAWVCISPWNFPLAIFVGQVAAALSTGNTVLAKPAEQTPVVALEAVRLLHASGVPTAALQLLHGSGETVGASLVAAPGVAGVVFTGSTPVAKIIQRTLAAKDGPIVPLIAETGGINAMLVDSTALPEQVADAVVQSAFRSAGQRCSALRLLCLHEAVADTVIDMIRGAASELVTGDPADWATDLGPLIDADAHGGVMRQIARLQASAVQRWPALDSEGRTAAPMAPGAAVRGAEGSPVGAAPHRCPAGSGGSLQGEGVAEASVHTQSVVPHLFEVKQIAAVDQEIFGPVLQVVRWSGDPLAVIQSINALGYGLTLGIQTRIDSRAQALASAARVGNVYVNRNMIGAVVGVQPFGGEGLSGTGPKAGGPYYLMRFCGEQTVTINTTAAGGNVPLFAT